MVRRTGMAATAALAVLIGGCCAGCGTASSAGAASSGVTSAQAPAAASRASAGAAMAASPTVATMPAGRATPVPSRSAAATSAPSARGGSPSAPSSTAAAPPSASARAATSAATSAAPDQGGTPAAQVLALINQARAAAGLPALTVTSGLEASSAAHNSRMAGGCGLSHQCPGEAALGARETAAGVGWTAAGENIGEGGPVADTTAAIAQMAVGLTQSMLNEQPPDDGHRLNILSSTFTHIGIAVYRDSGGTVWLTQDCSN